MKIVLEHLTKKFPNRDRKVHEDVVAVNDFTFEIPDGKLVSLLGPSGCGKSTTLNMICGLEKPTSGKIYFGDDDVTDLPPENRGVGMVFQSYALYPHLTVRNNILFPLQNLKGKDKLSKQEMNRRAEEAAKLVQITELMDRKPSEMSGGQQQRVAIARALVKMPKVLLLDEPLSNLDARLRLQTREEIRRIQKETGITTIFVTHDQEEAMSISDEMVVMKQGILQQIGRPQEIYDNPRNLFVAKFLGTPPINVFEGRIENGKVMIGEDEILPARSAKGIPARQAFSAMSADASGQASPSASGDTENQVSYGSHQMHKLPDQPVYVGIRPEAFVLDDANGPFHCEFRSVEVMGRDTSIVCMHEGLQGASIRAIVPSDTITSHHENGIVRFSLKPAKVHIFHHETQERLSLG